MVHENVSAIQENIKEIFLTVLQVGGGFLQST